MVDAGRRLADSLRRRHRTDTVVIGVTGSGLSLAAQVARNLGAALDICVVRKLVVMRAVPVTIGAIAEGGSVFFDPQRLTRFNVSSHELGEAIGREAIEVSRLAAMLRVGPPADVRDRDVILVDDQIVTGQTVRTAALALTARGAHGLELAVPYANADVIDDLRSDFDRVTFLDTSSTGFAFSGAAAC